MHIRIISVANKLPQWIEAGYEQYSCRLPREWALEVVEISPAKQHKSAKTANTVATEGDKMLAKISQYDFVVALDARGQNWNNEKLLQKMQQCQLQGDDLVFLIGGADGLAPACLQRANASWSLSELIFPHGLVRVMLIEQLYRSWTLMNGHPYHSGH